MVPPLLEDELLVELLIPDFEDWDELEDWVECEDLLGLECLDEALPPECAEPFRAGVLPVDDEPDGDFVAAVELACAAEAANPPVRTSPVAAIAAKCRRDAAVRLARVVLVYLCIHPPSPTAHHPDLSRGSNADQMLL